LNRETVEPPLPKSLTLKIDELFKFLVLHPLSYEKRSRSISHL
jgi:hypothetical protein